VGSASEMVDGDMKELGIFGLKHRTEELSTRHNLRSKILKISSSLSLCSLCSRFKESNFLSRSGSSF
jgi:hypothetical protein